MDVGKLFDPSQTFETERLIIRIITPDDARDYFEIASSPIVSAETIWNRHQTQEDTIGYLQRVLNRFEKKEEIHWGIIYKETNKLIGRTGLIMIDSEHEKAELGYVISNHYWNQGIATEAAYPILEYAFNVVGFNRIEARCRSNNVGSYRVMEKLGLVFEGILRKQLKIKGKFMDQKLYSILKVEFESTFGEDSSIG